MIINVSVCNKKKTDTGRGGRVSVMVSVDGGFQLERQTGLEPATLSLGS